MNIKEKEKILMRNVAAIPDITNESAIAKSIANENNFGKNYEAFCTGLAELGNEAAEKIKDLAPLDNSEIEEAGKINLITTIDGIAFYPANTPLAGTLLHPNRTVSSFKALNDIAFADNLSVTEKMMNFDSRVKTVTYQAISDLHNRCNQLACVLVSAIFTDDHFNKILHDEQLGNIFPFFSLDILEITDIIYGELESLMTDAAISTNDGVLLNNYSMRTISKLYAYVDEKICEAINNAGAIVMESADIIHFSLCGVLGNPFDTFRNLLNLNILQYAEALRYVYQNPAVSLFNNPDFADITKKYIDNKLNK